jgi:hypothetical protein
MGFVAGGATGLGGGAVVASGVGFSVTGLFSVGRAVGLSVLGDASAFPGVSAGLLRAMVSFLGVG